jgi:hypothetical protein
LALVAAFAGCTPPEGVVRVVDGRRVSGAFVPAEAYAAYLRAAVAEESGDLAGAVEGYTIASALGPDDPEPWARLGAVRCRRDLHDPKADEAIDHALSIDGAYAPALEARAACAERRGDSRVAVEAARRAAQADPSAAAPLGSLARLDPASSRAESEELRQQLVALTLVSGTNAAAWEALAAWARGHGDGALEARALARVVALEPEKRQEIDAAALRLAGDGEIAEARSLARARVEADGRGGIDPRLARLAIDGALLEGDLRAAERLATHAHVPLTVVAARALLLGDTRGALELAQTIVEADPGAVAARLVLVAAADAARDSVAQARALASRASGSDGTLPAEVWLAYGRMLSRSEPFDATRAFLQAANREPAPAGDALTTGLSVALAADGILDARELDANGRIELAERRSETPAADLVASADARHALLGLARRAPRDPQTLALARRLARARTRDPIVAVAFARLALAGAADTLPVADALAKLDPADPLLAGAALDCAVKAGDTRAIPVARARLAAVAQTPAERRRTVE